MSVQLVAWAWWSKEAGSVNEIRVLTAGGEHEGAAQEIDRLHPGEPQPDAAIARLPWAVFSSSAGSGPTDRTVCWWDWTGTVDGRNRPIFAVLYLRLRSATPLTYRYLADYAGEQWSRHHENPAWAPADPPAAPTAALPDDETLRWAGAVAALTLQSAVRIDASSSRAPTGPEAASEMFDAVAALLPAATRESLRLTTGTVRSENGPFNLAVGKATGRRTVHVTRDADPDLTGHPEALAYRDTLERLRQHFPLENIVGHLGAVHDMPDQLGPDAARTATARLAGMDQLIAVGTALLQHRPVDDGLVLQQVSGRPLAGRVPREMHQAFLTRLLTHGGPAGLRAAADNWLPEATPQLVGVLAAPGEPDPAWLAAVAAGPVRAAGAGTVLLTLLERSAVTPSIAELIVHVAGNDGLRDDPEGDRVRSWLLAPGHDEAAAAVVRAGPEVVVGWLAGATGPPPWVPLLRSAIDGDHPAAGVVGPGWLAEAFDIGRGRHGLRPTLGVLMPNLIAAAADGRLDERIAGRLRAEPATDAADRAAVDFVLLLAGPEVPPGLRPGSGWAADPAYAEQLGALGAGHQRFRDHLRSALAGDATDEALTLLENFERTKVTEAATVLHDALFVARQRSDLLARPEPRTLRDAVLAADPGLRRAIVEREAHRMSRARAEPDEFAGVLVDGVLLQCDRQELGVALNRWAATARPGQLSELTRAAGERRTDAGGWPARSEGLALVVPLLGPDHRAVLDAALRSELTAEARALDERIAALVREREVLAGVEGLLSDGGDDDGRGGAWTSALRWLGLSPDPARGRDHR